MKNFQNRMADQDLKKADVQAPLVSEYMTKDLITFKKDTDISEVIDSLLKHRISGAPVLNDRGEVEGLIDDKDCLNVIFGNVYNRVPSEPDTVSRYMSNIMKTISVNDNILDVAYVFSSSPYKRLLVMDDDKKLVGQISRRDILRAIKEMT